MLIHVETDGSWADFKKKERISQKDVILKWMLFTESVAARLGLNVSVAIWSVTNLSQLPVHVGQLQELKFESSIKRGSRESGGMGKHRHHPAHFCHKVRVENNQWRVCATTGLLEACRHATCSQLSSAGAISASAG